MRIAALDRRVRQEARKLARELRRGASRGKLAEAVKQTLTAEALRLEEAAAATTADAAKRLLPTAEALIDSHLAPTKKSSSREYGESLGIAILLAILLRVFVVQAFKIPSSSMVPTLEIGDHIFVNKIVYGVRIPFTKQKLFELRPPERGEVIVFMNPCTPERDFIKRVVAVAGDTVEVRCDILYVNHKPVPHELIEEQSCKYWDNAPNWHEERCSRYRETVGEFSYTTLHSPRRPETDRERVAAGDRVYEYELYSRDFPDVPTERDEVEGIESGFICESMTGIESRRAPVGKFEWSIPPFTNPAQACAPRYHYVVPEGHVFGMGDNRANSRDSRYWGPIPLGYIQGKAMFRWLSHNEKRGFTLSRIGEFIH